MYLFSQYLLNIDKVLDIVLSNRHITAQTWTWPLRREWQPIPVLLAGKFHGQRCLEGYSPWGHKESDRTERLTLSLLGCYLLEKFQGKCSFI